MPWRCLGIYPLVIAIGGDLYPNRLSTLSGGLSFSATIGTVIYPPLIGLVALARGGGMGLFGGALLGIPAAIAIWLAGEVGRNRVGAVAPLPSDCVDQKSIDDVGPRTNH